LTCTPLTENGLLLATGGKSRPAKRQTGGYEAESEATAMEIKTLTDMDLRNMFRKELETLREYEEIFDGMTAEEKEELREWMASGNSINSNPYLLYGDNGELMDLVNARRVAEEMAAYPERFRSTDVENQENRSLLFDDVPF
jgi:hypothetical protein